MLNAEEILLLEKKWFKYKLKSRLKYFFVFFVLILLAFASYFIPQDFFTKHTKKVEQSIIQIEKKQVPQSTPVKPQAIISQPSTDKSPNDMKKIDLSAKNESNTTKSQIVSSDINSSKTNQQQPINTQLEIKKVLYHLKLIPTLKTNDLFTSSGSLKLNEPNLSIQKKEQPSLPEVKKDSPITKVNNISTPTKVTQNQESTTHQANQKSNIKISSEEIDTITYLKEKFYSTENIVFAIMLSEEYYNSQNYNESLKWALSANEIDPKNDKSWFWFAKNKVKLGQVDDALKALKAYLAENNSSRLKTLLKQIETGDHK